LLELGKNKNIVVLTGDLSKSTMVDRFAQQYPSQFFNIGIAEQNMANIAAGLSLTGKIPFFTTYAAFATTRALDMIRVTICYSNLNVKIIGAHAGISVGPDGATHQALEDIATMRVLPNMKVIVPADYWETYKATIQAAEVHGPVYIRFGRERVPVITRKKDKFEIGKGNVLREGNDLSIIACGLMVEGAIRAFEELKKMGIAATVINLHTIKPIDKDLIVNCAKLTGAIVTAEEHQIYGGLYSAVSEILSLYYPVPVEPVAIKDRFGKSGAPEKLLKYFHLTYHSIVEACLRVLKRK